ncbi:hypothetical protein GCWU000342_00158 [Shuttleworthella satelles DSM 14600]|uniref:Uncharacterized protein n=1 Tax=Shuttleworthella satelles DSM 14600 TaxID=626523 RepID=C4G7Z2_9FIRM|nr:hypothetical protein GCWU000342_00158 [Shuttleworthia satelles DSM 14600]
MRDPTCGHPESLILAEISIHGSREGPDEPAARLARSHSISIHGSREGPDALSAGYPFLVFISIHGSREGPDH